MTLSDRRQKTREALTHHTTVDPHATERETIGAQIGLLGMMGVIILVGVLQMDSALRIPFMTFGFMSAFYLGLSVKRWLDDRSGR
jgi:hypothetical protein